MAQIDLTTEDGILFYLQSGKYGPATNATKAERLMEGAAGFVYRVHLKDSEWPTVIVKHAEAYAARAQHWKLDTNRMFYEYEGMKYLSKPEMQSDKFLRTPQLLFYDDKDHVLIMEDAGRRPSLKGWLKAGANKQTTIAIGEALGRFLANVHNSTVGNEDVLKMFNGNETAKYLSGTLYFGTLPTAAKKFGYFDDYFQKAADIGKKEVFESTEVLTMGDFWTGNILVSAEGSADLNLYVLDLELSKPGTAEFDIGQNGSRDVLSSLFPRQRTWDSLAAGIPQSLQGKQGRIRRCC